MQLRNLSARIGAVVRTVDAYPYSLPKGLPDGAEVTVVSYDLRTYNYIVRDAPGREWTIKALQNLDAGNEYMLGGRWLPEDHPLVLAELRRTCTCHRLGVAPIRRASLETQDRRRIAG